MIRLRIMVDRLIGLSNLLGSAALALVTIVILIDVIGRYFGAPLRGAQDIGQMGMVLIVFGGMAWCGRQGGHIAIDIFENAFPERVNHAIDIGVAFLGAFLFAAIAWKVIQSAQLSLMLNLATNIIQLPKAWFQWALAGFSILTALTMLLRGIELILGGSGRAERKEAML
ncbi:TRAP transporter small permease [Chelativorans sp. AA-79]|uniref:TRAP transporter small permease n=1 Tax=Chelativorans sp. AA-79 TaxID=3028735 RepID=UPI0023FA2CAA|nr:TRAP transporter small permease [Chelativorans sp. AA-79]WEX10533.1 TRAP transporter small permease [Chelativorans sp. AA-79]